MNIQHWMAVVAVTVLLSGCAKNIEEYNMPADYWYEKMISSVANGSLEKADGYYSSLQSEHIGSPLLPEATLIMAQAHLAQEEYLLSDHFLDEYSRRYANKKGREYVEYLKVKSKFYALPNPGRDQGLINQTLESVGVFRDLYAQSPYLPLANTIELQMQLAKGTLNNQIADLYDRLGKPKAAAYYRNIAPVTWVDPADVVPVEIPWYKEMFEGDGTSSWYAFMIPQTKSIVSMDDDMPIKSIDANETAPITPAVEAAWYDFLIPDSNQSK
jgi:outer membrane protein assembly factor BamD